jgi:hypothetical protein
MTRNFIHVILLLTLQTGSAIYCSGQEQSVYSNSDTRDQDTIRARQILYNGTVWSNKYHRIEGDQFLFSEIFMPGTISMNGKTFTNVRLKYDIYSDAIITPLNREVILQLNKEMVDSFTINFEDKVYSFTNIRNDTLKDFGGYVNLLYKGKSAFYVRYKKSISPSSSPRSDGHFFQSHTMYYVKDKVIYPMDGTTALFRILDDEKEQIKNFIKKNKLRISNKIPDSFIPVIKFYDSISK